MFVVGITGGIGAGKSQAAAFFREKGVMVLDADDISREITQSKGDVLVPLRELLGDSFFQEDGTLDRRKVAEKVFSDKKLLDEYSKVIHKEVLRQMKETIESESKKGTKLLVLDVPIPVKNGFIDQCNHVLVVSAEEHLRIERLLERGMQQMDIQRRMMMQMNNDEYEALGDFVMKNNGSSEELQKQINHYIDTELGKRGIRL